MTSKYRSHWPMRMEFSAGSGINRNHLPVFVGSLIVYFMKSNLRRFQEQLISIFAVSIELYYMIIYFTYFNRWVCVGMMSEKK